MRLIVPVTLAVLVLVMGCSPPSTNPKLVGTYLGTNSETLIFTTDTRVFHTQIVNGKEERHFLGYYASSSSGPYFLRFVAPDTSRFVGTSFVVSSNFSSVTATWEASYELAKSWQTNYYKSVKTD